MTSRAHALGRAVALAVGIGWGVHVADAADRRPVVPPAVSLVVGWSGASGRASSAATGVDASELGGLSVAVLATWRPPARRSLPAPDDAQPAVDATPRAWSPGESAVEAASRAAHVAELRSELDSLLRAPPADDARTAVDRALRRSELEAWIAVVDPRAWRALGAAEAGEGP
jgi:hypothetical protein